MKLLVATRNPHKVDEIREILADVPDLELVGLDDAGIAYRDEEEEIEPYDTFEENALSKARYYARRSGLPTVSDDSGLEVDALGGAPGVRSRRYAPGDASGDAQHAANNRHLLAELAGVAPEDRGARFVCAVAFAGPEGEEHVLRGTLEGRIGLAPAGDGGFGYDPLFLLPDREVTVAELPGDDKHRISHRGVAFRAFEEWWVARDPGSTGGVAS